MCGAAKLRQAAFNQADKDIVQPHAAQLIHIKNTAKGAIMKITNRSLVHWAVRFSFAALILQPLTAAPLGTAFTYQGRLLEGTNACNGNAEFVATLWDVASGGTALATNASGSVIVGVTNGLFVLPLDFGTNFPGDARWLQLEVRTTIGSFNTLSPRQALTPAPYALYASSAGAAATASSVPAANITGTLSDARLSGNVALLAGSQTFTGTKIFQAAPSFSFAGAPFTVANSTVVTGLNADLLDGNQASAFALASGSANYIQNQNSGAQAGNLWISGTARAGYVVGDGSSLTSLNASSLASGTVADARLTANVPKLNATQTFTADNTLQNGVFTTEGTSGSGMRFGSSDLYSTGVQTIVSFASGALLWNNTTSQVILTNKNGFTYIHYAVTKREDMAGSFTNLSGYANPNTAVTLATLNNNGEHLTVDVASRDLGWGFVHLYCFYDNSYLRCNYYYQCQ
jgi:hypothetical protein